MTANLRITVTEEAYVAIAGPKEAQGGPFRYLWLPEAVLAALTAARGHGESYSDVILRLAKMEAAL